MDIAEVKLCNMFNLATNSGLQDSSKIVGVYAPQDIRADNL